MNKLGDVRKFIADFNVSDELFNFSPNLRGKFQMKFRAIGRAICEEQGITNGDQARRLSDDTPLGAESKELTEDLYGVVSFSKRPVVRKLNMPFNPFSEGK